MSNETMDQDELDRQLAAMAGGEDAPDGADDDELAAEWEAALAGDDSKPSAGADKAQPLPGTNSRPWRTSGRKSSPPVRWMPDSRT